MAELAQPKAEQPGSLARPQDGHLVMHRLDLPVDGRN
jgi:hypothetical protein